MNILQVTPRYPPQSGGVETHVAAISERLVDRGHSVTVVTADASGEGQQRESRNGVSVRRYRSVAPADTIHVCPQITAAVHNTTVDIVHAHNYHSFPLFFAALGAGDRRFIVTTHYHGGSANTVRDRLLSVYRPFGRWAVRRADQVIAVSEWEREQLAASFDVDATVIPNGINIERFANAEALERNRDYLLCVGRLEEYKGIQYVIQALTKLPDYDLLVAGAGSYRGDLERLAQIKGVANRVEFLGYVDDEELPRLYAGAEAYITLSEFESYGITVAEALAAGTPCVVRESGALVNWTDRSDCIGVASTESDIVAHAIENASKIVPTAASLPTWDTIVDKTLYYY